MGGTTSDIKVGIWRKEATPNKEKMYASVIQDTPSEEDRDVNHTKRGSLRIQVEPI